MSLNMLFLSGWLMKACSLYGFGEYVDKWVMNTNNPSPIVLRFVYRYVLNGQIPDNFFKLVSCTNSAVHTKFIPLIVERMLQTRDVKRVEDELCRFIVTHELCDFKLCVRSLDYGLRYAIMKRIGLHTNVVLSTLYRLNLNTKQLDNLPPTCKNRQQFNAYTNYTLDYALDETCADIENLLPQLSNRHEFPPLRFPKQCRHRTLMSNRHPLLPAILLTYGLFSLECLKQNWKRLHVDDVVDACRTELVEHCGLLTRLCDYFQYSNLYLKSIDYISSTALWKSLYDSSDYDE